MVSLELLQRGVSAGLFFVPAIALQRARLVVGIRVRVRLTVRDGLIILGIAFIFGLRVQVRECILYGFLVILINPANPCLESSESLMSPTIITLITFFCREVEAWKHMDRPSFLALRAPAVWTSRMGVILV
jgi:hypothetical protein